MSQQKLSRTMKDVAKRAGVSTATVSRAFSNPEKLSFNTRLRVEEAIVYCGYSVTSQNSSPEARIILVLLSDTNDLINNEIIKGIKEAIVAHNYILFVSYNIEQEVEFDQYDLHYATITRQICGIIQIGSSVHLNWLRRYKIESLPRIVIGYNDYSANVINIDVDRLTAAFTAVNYLCQLGYSRIAYIAETPCNNVSDYQEQGYRQVLKRRKIALDKNYIIYGNTSFTYGQQAIEQLMSLPIPPNAVYCQHDIIAIGAIYRLKQLKFDVPRDLSIMGFGNIELSKYCDLPLTTVSYPKELIGKQAVTVLLQWVKNPVSRPEPYLFESEIIERKTTIKRQY